MNEISHPSYTAKTIEVLSALAADQLKDTSDWIKYVAPSLTEVPPTDWKDDHRAMFENSLRAMSDKFKRLARITLERFQTMQRRRIGIVTREDGKHSSVAHVGPEQKKILGKIVNDLKRNMHKGGFGDKDMDALVVILTSDHNRYDAA